MKKLTLSILVILLSVALNAQDTLRVVGLMGATSSTVPFDMVDTVGFEVENTGQTNYTGDVQLKWLINDSIERSIPAQNMTINAGEKEGIFLIDSIMAPAYAPGGNTVVIWPEAIGVDVSDTLQYVFLAIELGTKLQFDEIMDVEILQQANRIHVSGDFNEIMIFSLDGRLISNLGGIYSDRIDFEAPKQSAFIMKICNSDGCLSKTIVLKR